MAENDSTGAVCAAAAAVIVDGKRLDELAGAVADDAKKLYGLLAALVRLLDSPSNAAVASNVADVAEDIAASCCDNAETLAAALGQLPGAAEAQR